MRLEDTLSIRSCLRFDLSQGFSNERPVGSCADHLQSNISLKPE